MKYLNHGFTEEDYQKYLKKSSKVYNEKLRDEHQTFADFMCEGSIVEGLDEKTGKELLETIKNLGYGNANQRFNKS